MGVARLTSSARTIWPKSGPRWKPKWRPPGCLDHDVGPHDVRRHQVRRELDPREAQVQPLRQRLDQQGLPEPGDAFQQGVPSGEQADQDPSHDLRVAHHHLADLVRERREHCDETAPRALRPAWHPPFRAESRESRAESGVSLSVSALGSRLSALVWFFSSLQLPQMLLGDIHPVLLRRKTGRQLDVSLPLLHGLLHVHLLVRQGQAVRGARVRSAPATGRGYIAPRPPRTGPSPRSSSPRLKCASSSLGSRAMACWYAATASW